MLARRVNKPFELQNHRSISGVLTYKGSTIAVDSLKGVDCAVCTDVAQRAGLLMRQIAQQIQIVRLKRLSKRSASDFQYTRAHHAQNAFRATHKIGRAHV